jgi:hypothetical protein
MLSRELRARRLEAQALAFRGELSRLSGRRSDALANVSKALAICRETGMAYMGPCILAILALVTDDARVRDQALVEGQQLLDAGAPSYNHFLFRRDAIQVCLGIAAWDRAHRHVAALEDFAHPEPTPWTRYIVQRGRALAAWGRGLRDDALTTELVRLRAEGERLGLKITIPAIDTALSAGGLADHDPRLSAVGSS